MKLYDIIVDCAYEWLKKQNTDGSMPSGHNWPYYDEETNFRNSFHWAIIFIKAFKISNDDIFIIASNKIADYILANKPEHNFQHRKTSNKDKSNWLIWPAWSMESLLIMADSLQRPDLELLATKIFYNHIFDEKKWLWNCLDIDWKHTGLDKTFNHQLWFWAIWSMFDKKHKKIHNQVKIFNDNLDKNLKIYSDWLIFHKVNNFKQ